MKFEPFLIRAMLRSAPFSTAVPKLGEELRQARFAGQQIALINDIGTCTLVMAGNASFVWQFDW
jgi:hypothetical protein